MSPEGFSLHAKSPTCVSPPGSGNVLRPVNRPKSVGSPVCSHGTLQTSLARSRSSLRASHRHGGRLGPYLPRMVDEMKKLADKRRGNGAAWGSLTFDLRI